MFALLSLPHELLIQILANLDAMALTRTCMTCKALRDVLRSSSELLCILQLHLDGLCDAGTSTGCSDLLIMVLERRRAWFEFGCTKSTKYETKHNCLAYELTGGVFATTDGDCLELKWLPTRNRTHGQQTIYSAGVSMRDLAMDPTQDLIVFLEDDAQIGQTLTLHIRTISTNAIHPRARDSPLQCNLHGRGFVRNVCVEVVRDRLVLYFSVALQPIYSRVLVWDWTTSELILDSPKSSLPRAIPFDFALLDSKFFLTAHPLDSGLISLYQLPRSGAGSGAILLANLHLPSISMGTTVARIDTHSGPLEAGPLPGVAFMEKDENRLHAFTIVYRHSGLMDPEGSQSVMSMDLFVHQRVFMKYCRSCTGVHRDILWDEWGPSNTRMLRPSSIPTHWQRYIHGQHVVYPLFSRPGVSYSVKMLDFSLAAVLNANGIDLTPSPSSSSTTSESAFGHVTLMPPSTISAMDEPYFLDIVETHLPCVTLERQFKASYAGYMVYENGVVGINIGDDENLQLDVYALQLSTG
ncbi:hypothetical protein BDN70DRAFT_884502 [Pholiota conissans]|uniref:F-box domain-containing protein n=1 Tax=Pholiota conissans TaxID=109636 RepID=A0A9P5YT99_9AGAR|nr:hypothetical protein BDN70DRAFT_884502 [Pholiota conissans]